MPFAELYKNIFEKDGPGPDSPALLQELVKEYPYFSLAHFYLLQQTPVTDENYEKVAARTAQHFNNPYFLQSQLREASPRQTNIEILDEDSAASPTFVPELKIEEDREILLTDNVVENELQAEDYATDENAEVNDQLQEVYKNNYPEPEESEEESASVETTSEPEGSEIEPQQDLIPNPEENEISEEVSAEANPHKEAKTSEENGIKYVPINLPEESLPEVKDATEEIDTDISEDEVETNNEDEEVVDDTLLVSNTDQTTELKLPVQHQKQMADSPMIFEPLHASDYFASQGIKLREEAQPADKLGKQLKSFTEWLKTMKKVHEPGNESGSVNIDLSVQTLAEKSNKEEEILTEAMAEVFLQQGKGNKAREIYQKLSLLNPAKSSYFAAKIDQIK